MPDKSSGSVSAMVDSELSARETKQLISAMSEDEKLREEWRDYHLVGAVLRNEKLCGMDGKIDWEAEAAKLPDDAKIVSLQDPRVRSRLYHHRRWLSGVGIAAAMLVGVFVLIDVGDPELVEPSDPTIAASGTPSADTTTSAEYSSVMSIPEIGPNPLPDEVMRVRDLMLRHHSTSLQAKSTGSHVPVSKVSTDQ